MERIKELRAKRGLSQAKFAKKINVAQNTVSNWENGVREPDSEMLKKLSAFFNVTVDYILGNTNKPGRLANDELKSLGIEWIEVTKKARASGLTPQQVNDLIDIMNRKIDK